MLEVDKATVMTQCLCHCLLQEKRRAERAEQQRIRAEKEKERQARLAVSLHFSPCLSFKLEISSGRRKPYRFCLSQSKEEMITLLEQGRETGVARSQQCAYLITFPAVPQKLKVSPRVTYFCLSHFTGGKGTERGRRCQEKS